jgi:hypothetical protein
MQPKFTDNESLLALEDSLKRRLHPVTPNRQFVHGLRRRLEESNRLNRQRRTAATLLTIAGGLLIGLAIFLIGRGFLSGSGKA